MVKKRRLKMMRSALVAKALEAMIIDQVFFGLKVDEMKRE